MRKVRPEFMFNTEEFRVSDLTGQRYYCRECKRNLIWWKRDLHRHRIYSECPQCGRKFSWSPKAFTFLLLSKSA